jgi:hypothetical protein
VSQSVSSTKIDPLPVTGSAYGGFALQPTCGVQTGTIRITAQNNVQYSIGAGIKKP